MGKMKNTKEKLKNEPVSIQLISSDPKNENLDNLDFDEIIHYPFFIYPKANKIDSDLIHFVKALPDEDHNLKEGHAFELEMEISTDKNKFVPGRRAYPFWTYFFMQLNLSYRSKGRIDSTYNIFIKDIHEHMIFNFMEIYRGNFSEVLDFFQNTSFTFTGKINKTQNDASATFRLIKGFRPIGKDPFYYEIDIDPELYIRLIRANEKAFYYNPEMKFHSDYLDIGNFSSLTLKP